MREGGREGREGGEGGRGGREGRDDTGMEAISRERHARKNTKESN